MSALPTGLISVSQESTRTVIPAGSYSVPLILRSGTVKSCFAWSEAEPNKNTDNIAASDEQTPAVKREYLITLENGAEQVIVTDTNLGLMAGSRVGIVYLEDKLFAYHPVSIINYANQNSTVLNQTLQTSLHNYAKGDAILKVRLKLATVIGKLGSLAHSYAIPFAISYSLFGILLYFSPIEFAYYDLFLLMSTVSLWVFAFVGEGMCEAVSNCLKRPLLHSENGVEKAINHLMHPALIVDQFIAEYRRL